ncbi:hypothetical protein GCM10022415_23540 [Knoellia locipacati]|uniref:Uncharacterized protein n=1 Tax=Knoellia locipacati TaxID=882824 RepID=A0A512T2F0_9MICO|nr:hypothetical protein [Knoellia locipacati]GEQ14303.1 hypothetical protein KLO01_23500 [Knoellia locipacati]
MTTTPPQTAPFAQSVRILSTALMGALVFIGIAMFFVLGADDTPPVWLVVAQVAAGVVVHLVIEAVGYRVQPLDPGLSDADAGTAARARWQSSMILRFALSEVIAIASLVAAFVLEGGILAYAVGAVVSLVLMAVHVWPGARPVGKVAIALEAAGRRSTLREEFGVPAPGPLQQF